MSNNSAISKKQLLTLALGATGVVFGDIGTSPLYAVSSIFAERLPIDKMHVLGVLSLIFWVLTLVVSIKYATFIMRADNKGEGGIMALLALALQTAKHNPLKSRFIITIGLLGAAFFFGDGVITPAISVLSAVEGLKIISPHLNEFILPITIVILCFLFLLQSKGTGAISKLYSPIICLWFVSLAILGGMSIIKNPEVLYALNPYYAIELLRELGWHGFIVMGLVVLVITGAEALYADMGHFGLKPIRYAWFGFVFPSLLLNYFGQGALLLEHPHAISNPFFLLAPGWALYPLLILATLSTVIASQAVISGAFSVIRQAIQLGYTPRMAILHTSSEESGQIYVPGINWILMFLVLLVVLEFKSSAALASAYGIAVTGTMTAVTILAAFVIQELWQWKKWRCAIFLITFLSIDFVFLFANSLKILHGGWLPLLIGTMLFLIMTTWIKGRSLLLDYDKNQLLFEDLEDELKNQQGAIVKGTAIYFTKKTIHGVPAIFLHNFEHNHVLHEQMIFLSIVTKEQPFVGDAQRVHVHTFGKNNSIHRMKFFFGFMQTPDVKAALMLCEKEGIKIDLDETSFFVGSGRISFRKDSPMPKWRRPLFSYLFHNAASAIEFFKIPIDRVIELGIRIEL